MIAWGWGDLISLEVSNLLSVKHAAVSVGMVSEDCKKCMGNAMAMWGTVWPARGRISFSVQA